jgi:hypothetical protein
MGPNRKVIYNLFGQTDNELHAREKRPISKFYSMNGILPLEPLIDSVIQKLCGELEKRFVDPPNPGKSCNLGDWILYCTTTFCPLLSCQGLTRFRHLGRRGVGNIQPTHRISGEWP